MIHGLCKVTGCRNNGRYCRIPGHIVATITPVSKPAKESDSMKEQLKVYKKLAKQYITTHPKCEVKDCRKVSECIHHKAGRIGENLTDIKNFLAVCMDHHREIEENPEWAKGNGYSKMRLKNKSI